MKKNLREMVDDYRKQVEALALQAAELPSLKEKLSALEIERTQLSNDLTSVKASLKATEDDRETIKAALEEANGKVAILEAEKKTSEDKALELLAGLGIATAPSIEAESEQMSAEAIRKKYLAITDPVEKGKFYAEHKDTILNGF